MSHARLIFDDAPEVIDVPAELRHQRVEVIFLSLDDEAQAPKEQASEHQNKPRNLLELMGKGKGCFNTADEIDRFIRSERDTWDN